MSSLFIFSLNIFLTLPPFLSLQTSQHSFTSKLHASFHVFPKWLSIALRRDGNLNYVLYCSNMNVAVCKNRNSNSELYETKAMLNIKKSSAYHESAMKCWNFIPATTFLYANFSFLVFFLQNKNKIFNVSIHKPPEDVNCLPLEFACITTRRLSRDCIEIPWALDSPRLSSKRQINGQVIKKM